MGILDNALLVMDNCLSAEGSTRRHKKESKMHATDIVGFTYNADIFCNECAAKAGADLIAFTDSEGNESRPVFASDEFDLQPHCSACNAEIEGATVTRADCQDSKCYCEESLDRLTTCKDCELTVCVEKCNCDCGTVLECTDCAQERERFEESYGYALHGSSYWAFQCTACAEAWSQWRVTYRSTMAPTMARI